MVQVFLTRAAQDDLNDAVAWYRTKAPHIVDRFRLAWGAAMRRIELNPQQFPVSAAATRKAAMAGFPYLIIFRLDQDVAYMIAIFHMSRDPHSWQTRT